LVAAPPRCVELLLFAVERLSTQRTQRSTEKNEPEKESCSAGKLSFDIEMRYK
jgi:hypothetical protein